jgi:hypothetical protein
MLVVPLRRSLIPAVEAHIHRNPRSPGARGWSTSSLEDAADTSRLELWDLSEHLDRCRRLRGRFFSALCLSDAVDRFLAPRFITTVVAITLLSAAFLMP